MAISSVMIISAGQMSFLSPMHFSNDFCYGSPLGVGQIHRSILRRGSYMLAKYQIRTRTHATEKPVA